ncbi:RNA polymerase sigma factor [Geodermatophilus sp. URMC 64]
MNDADVVPQAAVRPRRAPDDGSRADDAETWLGPLRAGGEQRELAIGRLHALLLRAARFEASRRRAALSGIGGRELDDLTLQAADDALVAVLARLDTFRGASRFTTWAYKFAIYETSVKLRRRAWQDREIPLEPQSWALLPERGEQPSQHAETAEVLAAVRHGIAALTPHQRHVLVALTLNDVPIDVLAERLGTTRGALYKTLHDARRALRGRLTERGLLSTATAIAEEAR